MSSDDNPAADEQRRQQQQQNQPPNQRPAMNKAGAAAVGSLRDLLESLRFDMDSGGGSGEAPADGDYDGYHPGGGGPGADGGVRHGSSGGGGLYFDEEEEDDERGRVFGDEAEEEKYHPHAAPPPHHAPPHGGPHGSHQQQAHGGSRRANSASNNEGSESDAAAAAGGGHHGGRPPYGRRSNPNITDDEGYRGGGASDYDDYASADGRSYTGSSASDDDGGSGASRSSSDSVKSYEDAGYDNEEDYLFDQYGGIGGTAEERAELAEALMHTLNVGPMADDLFYEEVAMCFLRCRERHRMRTRREEMRERKRAKRREGKKGRKKKSHRERGERDGGVDGGPGGTRGAFPGGGKGGAKKSGAGAGVKSEAEGTGDEGDMRERMAKLNMKDVRRGGRTTGVDSEYEVHASDDDDSVDLSRISEGMRQHVNVESDYEDVRRSRRRRSRVAGRGGKTARDEDDVVGGAGGGDDDELSAPSTPMSSTDKDDDSFMDDKRKYREKYNSSFDSEYSMEKDDFAAPAGSGGVGGGGGRRGKPRKGTRKGQARGEAAMEREDDDDDHHHHGGEDDAALYGEYGRGGRYDRAADDLDDGVGLSGLSGRPPPPAEVPLPAAAPVPEPVFRVDLKSNGSGGGGAGRGGKKAHKKGTGGGATTTKYPPPPPPPPPPRSGSHHDAAAPAPMDVDDDGGERPPSWEEKMARGAARAAEASMAKNDHESLRREFSMGQASDGEVLGGGAGGGRQKSMRGKHRNSSGPGMGGGFANGGPDPETLHSTLNQKSFYGFSASPDGADGASGDGDTLLGPDEDDETNAKRQRVAALRDEGRSYYINGAYRESVLCYTEAIGVHAGDDPRYDTPKNDETLAALYGNRAAALMMTGAYEGASADCDRALQCTETDAAAGSLESGPAFRSKILCRMARALLKAGSIWDADKAFNSSIQSAKEALAVVGGADGTLGVATPEETRSMEKILNQSITDATLGLSDVKRYRDAADSAKAGEANKGVSVAADRRNNVQLLMFINSALSVSPGSMELHERKVNALASLKRWAELGNHCERLAAEMVKIDGLFKDDLAGLNPFPDVRPAMSLKPDFFERNPDDSADPVSLRILSPKAVCDAVIRLPNGILPLYLRSLRLEERYTEAAKAGASIETHMSNSKHKGSRGNVPMVWLSKERDKLRRTMSWKEKGDTLFRNGDYERAAEKYALCLTIDNDGSSYNHNALENEDAGGRLHAVLHCNRAACLMALKKYREAVKECTAALRIHTHYMKAMLRRGRCFARIRQYQEAIAEYERYIQLVHEARRSPQNAANSNAACTFDRPIDITDAEYSKAKQELADVRKSMRQAAAHDQAQRKKQREQQFNFNKNFKAAANDAARRRQEAPGRGDAYTRKKQWDAGGASHQRPWDAFGGASPKKSGSRKSAKEPPAGSKPSRGGSGASRGGQSRSSSQSSHHHHQQQQQPPTAARPADGGDHYQVLGLTHTASSAEIKKAYHKMALKYHPDKNSDEGAADIFRRVKLAYEVLGNDQTRISYDAQRRGGRR